MANLILRFVAFVFFMIAGFDKVVLSQSPLDWIAFGLAAWVLATLLYGWGPSAPPNWQRQP